MLDAKNKGYANILIFEDDVYFKDGFLEKLDRSLKELPDNWDALTLAGTDHPQGKPKPFSLNLSRCVHTTGAYAYLVRESIYDVLIDKLSEEKKEVDIYYAELMPKLNWFRCRENIVGHHIGYSEIKQKEVNYEHLK